MPAESTAESPRPKHLNRQRGGYSAELENFLTSNAALMGERSNFGGLVASIERGGSGGCKGTKGVGVTRVEPFTQCGCIPPKGCGVCGMTAIHKAFERSDRCWQAWRGLTELQRNLAAARYLFSRDKIPTGMIGQLGDLAAVAYVVADSLGLSFRLVGDISKGKCRQWEDICAIALEETHRSWHEERAQADTDAAQEDQS